MRQPLSLRLRLTLTVGLLTGAMALLFGLLVDPLLRAHLLEDVDARLGARAARLAELPAGAQSAALEAAEHYAALIGPDGEPLARSPAARAEPFALGPELLGAARAGQTVATTGEAADGTPWRLWAGPAQTDAGPGGVLILGEPIAAQQQMLAQVRRLLLLCGALAALVALGAAALLTGRTLAPMTQLMRDAAVVVSSGRYDQRVPVLRRNDEVGQLAQTINTLIATVEQTLRQQREFLADTSHELRSPLTVVLANLNLLRRDLDPHERELSVDEAATEAQRMRRLINELLLLAQSDSAQVIAEAPVRLDWLVEDVVGGVRRQAPEHIYQLQVDEPLVVIGDEERLAQLLRNLLENAAKHTPPGTTVTVRLQRSGGSALLTVADSGPGIAAEHLPHIWDRYYRVDKVRSRAAGGTGLGLPIVKYIAEAHGGRVDVASEVGVGTTFTVELPLAPEAAAPARQPAETWRA